MELKNKTAFITGGSKGIGFGVAQSLVAQGTNVCITGRHQDSLDQAIQKLSSLGEGKAIAVKADVRDYSMQEKAVKETLDTFGTVDILIANAGLGHFASIADLTVDQWHETIDTNLTGVFFSIKACLESLKKSKGYIITISSLAGTNFFAGGAAYNASKFGLTGFTQSVMLDLRNDGIKVSTIMPGSVATYFNDNQPNDEDAWKIQIEDLGEIVVDLLQLPARTLPSKVEVRPSVPPKK